MINLELEKLKSDAQEINELLKKLDRPTVLLIKANTELITENKKLVEENERLKAAG